MSFDLSGGAQKSKSKTKESSTESKSGTQVQQLELEQEAINKIIEDVLSQSGGLKDIFGGEQTIGLFNTSVASQASGDLASKLVGELAKLTGRNVITTEEEAARQGTSVTKGSGQNIGFKSSFGGDSTSSLIGGNN